MAAAAIVGAGQNDPPAAPRHLGWGPSIHRKASKATARLSGTTRLGWNLFQLPQPRGQTGRSFRMRSTLQSRLTAATRFGAAAMLLVMASPAAAREPVGTWSGEIHLIIGPRAMASTRLVMKLTVSAEDAHGFVMTAVALDRNGVRRVVEGSIGVREFGNDMVPRVGVGGSGVDLCSTGLGCTVGSASGRVTIEFDGSQRLGSGQSLHIVAIGRDITLEGLGPGISVRAQRGGFRRITSSGSDSTTAGVGRIATEHFREATAPGGTRGSAAMLSIPCDLEGTGGAAMSGAPGELDCAGATATTAWAPSATSWRLSGEVVGLTQIRSRLAVIDL